MNNLLLMFDTINKGFFFFSLFVVSVLSALCGILIITSKNPITSILYLIGLFITIAGYLTLLGLNFIGISYLLVYVGAVSILFIFILMLINVRISEIIGTTSNNIPLAILVGSIFLPVTYKALPTTKADNKSTNYNTHYDKKNTSAENIIYNSENNLSDYNKDNLSSSDTFIINDTFDGVMDINTNLTDSTDDLFNYSVNEKLDNNSYGITPEIQSFLNETNEIATPYENYIINITIHRIIEFLNDSNIISKFGFSLEGLFKYTNKVTHYIWENILVDTPYINSIGNTLYTNYFIWLILASMILLLALVGCVIITIKNK